MVQTGVVPSTGDIQWINKAAVIDIRGAEFEQFKQFIKTAIEDDAPDFLVGHSLYE